MLLLTTSDYTLRGLSNNINNALTILAGIVLIIGLIYFIKKIIEEL